MFNDAKKEIGVLDLQGGVQEHLEHLKRIGVPCRPVKKESDFASLSGLIIPGGETTCLARLLRIFGLEEVVHREHQKGLKLWGTCAGAILLAKEVTGESPFLGLMDITVKRNAFGSQLESFATEALVPLVATVPIPLTFIRAPKILRTGPEVAVLLQIDDYTAAAENEDVLVTIFHPELTPSLAFHRYFVKKCGLTSLEEVTGVELAPPWDRKSWMGITNKGTEETNNAAQLQDISSYK